VTLFPAAPGVVITAGSDGNLWYAAESGGVGRVTPSGHVLYAHLLTGADTLVTGITTGPDGDIWFADNDSGYIGRLDPVTSRMSEYPTPAPPLATVEDMGNSLSVPVYEPPFAITSGASGGDMWFHAGMGLQSGYPRPDTDAGNRRYVQPPRIHQYQSEY
jgi:hypothetical protein